MIENDMAFAVNRLGSFIMDPLFCTVADIKIAKFHSMCLITKNCLRCNCVTTGVDVAFIRIIVTNERLIDLTIRITVICTVMPFSGVHWLTTLVAFFDISVQIIARTATTAAKTKMPRLKQKDQLNVGAVKTTRPTRATRGKNKALAEFQTNSSCDSIPPQSLKPKGAKAKMPNNKQRKTSSKSTSVTGKIQMKNVKQIFKNIFD